MLHDNEEMTNFATAKATQQRMTHRRYYIIIVLVIMMLATACQDKKGAARYSEADRQDMDSLVSSVSSIDSLRLMAATFQGSGNKLGQMTALRQMGKLLRENSRFMEAIDCHQQELTLATEEYDTLEMIQALNNIGTNYRRLGSLEEASSFHQQAMVLSTQMNDDSWRARKNRVVSLNGFGNVLLSMGNLQQADSVLRLALHGEQQLDSKLGQAINLANLGSIKQQQGQTDSALYYYRQSLAMNEQAGSQLGIGLCHIRFGEISEEHGDYAKAIEEYTNANDLLKEAGDEWHWLEAVLSIARIYIKEGKTADAQLFLDQACQTASSIGSQEHMVSVYNLYYQLYEKKGMLRQALDNYIRSSQLSDSLLDIQKLNNIQNQRLASERLNRQHEVELAQEQVALEHQQKTTVLVGAIAAVLLALALVGLMGYRMHTRNVKHRLMQQMQQVRESFFTNVTHEFRTPLTVILGMAHQLEDQQDGDMAQVRSSAKMIVRQGNSLLGLINQLLDISKVRSAVGEPKWSHGNIVAFVTMAIENFSSYAESKRQELTFTHSLTALDMDFVPDYMEKIMSNLITNAIKYTPSYGKINVTLEQSGTNRVKIQVFDTGRGIKAEALPHIFDAFFQGDVQEGDVGTGVGLSLVRLMVEAMNGTVSAESVEGQGSTFTVMLPVKSKKSLTPNSLSPNSLTPGPSPKGEGSIYSQAQDQGQVQGSELYTPLPLRGGAGGEAVRGEAVDASILIIEDNQDIAFYIGQHLPHCRLLYARSGDEGLQKAREMMPDLIITDLMMPGDADGLEVCRQVRRSDLLCHIPIIIITAKTTEADRILGLEAGADAYLVKPFNSEELLVRVRKLLEKQETLRNKFTQMSADDGQSSQQELSPQDRKWMNHLVDVVYRLMANGQTDMDSVASEMAVSRTQLNRKLLAITGQNASAYVMRLRLARSRRLLKADVNMPVGEVALRCGFDDVAYFSRIFKQTFQMTPTQYRKQQT